MIRSVKVYHSCVPSDFPLLVRILHSELMPDPCILTTAGIYPTSSSFTTVELVRTSESIFSASYLNRIDLYSIQKAGVLFFSTTPIPWFSDSPVSWGLYREELVLQLRNLLLSELTHVPAPSRLQELCTKYNLYRHAAGGVGWLLRNRDGDQCVVWRQGVKAGCWGSGECVEEESKGIERRGRETVDIERCGDIGRVGNDDSDDDEEEIEEQMMEGIEKRMDEDFSVYIGTFLQCGSNTELQIRYIAEIIDNIPPLLAVEMARSIGSACRYQAIYLHCILSSRLEPCGYRRLAFLHSMNASRLLKQGVNAEFEESIRFRALEGVKERNWILVMNEVFCCVERFDAERFGVNPYALRKVYKSDIILDRIDIQETGISRCVGNSVLFNDKDGKIYFDGTLQFAFLFSRISSAIIHGVIVEVEGYKKELLIPIHRKLSKTIELLDIVLRIPECIEVLDVVDIRFKELVFAGEVRFPIDITATWVKRKSILNLKDISNECEKLLLKFDIHNIGEFTPRVIGSGVTLINRNCVSVEIEDSNASGKYILHHEIAQNIFKTLELALPTRNTVCSMNMNK